MSTMQLGEPKEFKLTQAMEIPKALRDERRRAFANHDFWYKAFKGTPTVLIGRAEDVSTKYEVPVFIARELKGGLSTPEPKPLVSKKTKRYLKLLAVLLVLWLLSGFIG